MATAIGLGGTDAQERGERGEQRESPGVVRAQGGAAERATARLLSLPGERGPRASFPSPMRDGPPEAAAHVGGAGAAALCPRVHRPTRGSQERSGGKGGGGTWSSRGARYSAKKKNT